MYYTYGLFISLRSIQNDTNAKVILFNYICVGMNNFRFTKIIASVSPILAKETVLSKIINMVDAFTLTLSRGFDDNNKKYIDTLMKLDNSKTVILETKWNEVRIKNIGNFAIKEWQKVIVEYSEYTQENQNKIYIDYPNMDLISIWSDIKFIQSWVELRVEKHVDLDAVECTVIKAKEKHIFQYDRCLLEHNEDPVETLLERDQKDILWGLEYGVHIISLSACYSAQHIQSTKEFLEETNNGDMKVFAKIETRKWLDNLQEIVDVADGIILVADLITPILSQEETLDDIVQYIRWKWVPVLINYACRTSQSEYPLSLEDQLAHRCEQCVDWLFLEPMIIEDEVFDAIEKLETLLENYELKFQPKNPARFDEEDYEIRDYIIFNAYRVTQELDIRAIVCFTENGYTAARIASLNPAVPIITFTKSTHTYRFLNVVWWLKWYKISQSFNYENLKRIWKEMIRIIFKWNISLDDKVLIVQSNELNDNIKSDMINGIELYQFKNI